MDAMLLEAKCCDVESVNCRKLFLHLTEFSSSFQARDDRYRSESNLRFKGGHRRYVNKYLQRTVIEEYNGRNHHHIAAIVLCSAFSVFVGGCLTVQSSLNGKLKTLMNGTAYEVTLISFTNSICVLFVVSIATYCIKGDWFVFDGEALEWYIFNGGFLGPFIVGIYVICPQHIGFSATFIAGILGYLGSSVLFDHFGIFGVERTEITVWKTLGVTSVLIASVLINV